MGRPIIYLAFANNPQQSFLDLAGEDDAIFAELNNITEGNNWLDEFRIIRDQFTSTTEIVETLIKHKDDIVLFHFGGHASLSELYLTDQAGRAEGLAGLLGELSSLQCVFLNGCHTETFVPLLQENGISNIIATDRAVNDQKATQLASIFYGSLSKGASIMDAFNEAKNAVLTVSDKNIVTRFAGRIAQRAPENDASFPWGLYAKNEENSLWKLSDAAKRETVLPKIFGVKLAILGAIIFLFFLWTLRHLGTSSFAFFMANGPLAIIAIAGFLTKPFKNISPAFSSLTRKFIQFLIKTPTLILISIVLFLLSLFISSVIIPIQNISSEKITLFHQGKVKSKIILSGENDQENRFLTTIIPFSKGYQLEMPGHENIEIAFTPFLGARINSNQISPQKSLFLCLKIEDIMRSKRMKMIIKDNDNNTIQIDTIGKGSVQVGYPYSIEPVLTQAWENELNENGVPKNVSDIIISKWSKPKYMSDKINLVNNEMIHVNMFRNDSLVLERSIKIADKKIQYEILK